MPEAVTSIPSNWWALVLLGVVAGIFSGMLGLGSGIIIVPALVLLFDLPQKSAQGMCLAAMLPMVLVGAVRYKVNPSIDVDMVRVMFLAIGGVVGALVGVELAVRLPGGVLRKIFACVLIVAAVRMLLKPAGNKSDDSGPDVQERVQERAGPGISEQAE